ncbi:SMI1 / KNR4 family (SUKH-1) [Chitinophaga terrae (ex Kim and Jung 2007)]|uniref:SMI1 / KNR4 family (SUKH-1) n=1 Tax=Chitinophaga terrae (ex Kim and Jung 2007) TaxID=408074 RepID=A0A1H4A212_9BACT|nr:SMI1/KNR4 family protein [Chitinophaga terrae (ex Kim and Jung 2007)]GEP90002.1 hypothetical protein CTE07_16470 [Chitinophaga terrae (ex Kim and Jung 2007)]SEA29920.1 SMI1 / KNR4 family (SUKH-1) [Chitinophaga terrae (ex Kim and Jung 2007)]
MKDQVIKNIIDTHLNKWVEDELNKLPIEIDPAMAGPVNEDDDDWNTWLPIPSTVTDAEIEDFEKQLGHKLPGDYKTFLKHRHFYELQIGEVSFCSHPVNTWRADLAEKIFEGYPTKYLLDKGYIPFADWSDWGLLCFDTNRNQQDHNYPVVLWDHELADEVEDRYDDFYDMAVKIGKE